MKKSAKALRGTLWILLLALCASTVRGQQPSNPAAPPGSSSNQAPQEAAPKPAEQTTPEWRPLTGAEEFTLSRIGRRRAFVTTGFDVLELGDSNSPISLTESSLDSSTSFSGHLAAGGIWSKYQLLMQYRGGGYIYAQQPALDTSFHDFAVQQRIGGRRWNFLLSDRFGYLPVAGFGFYGFGSTQGNLNSVVSSLNPFYLTNQDIITARASRYSNTVLGEVEHRFGRKSSFAASAAYNLLTSPSPYFVDNQGAVFTGTYNYAPTARNTLALTYGYNFYRYPGQSQTVSDHLVRGAYQRLITRRLNLQLSGGPDVYLFSSTGSATSRRLSWGQQSLLYYNMRRTYLRFAYTAYLTGGAGVLSGARSHDARLTFGRRWSPKWSSSVDVGFARTSALAQSASQTSRDAVYRAWYGNAVATRPLGRRAQLLLTYGFQVQNSNASLSTFAVGNGVPVHHVFGLGFGWHLEPGGSSQLDSNRNFGIW